MSKRYVERVRRETDIVSLIMETVPLTRCGRVLRAPCPFCQNESEAEDFEVHRSEGFFDAACCNRDGDAFTWLMLDAHMSMEEAVAFCASRFVARDAA